VGICPATSLLRRALPPTLAELAHVDVPLRLVRRAETASTDDGRNTVNLVRVMYRRARYQVPVNPTAGLEIIARGEKPRRVVTPEVAARMVESIALEERALRACALYAGLRAGELQALRIEDVELFPDGRWRLLHVRGHGTSGRARKRLRARQARA
jgi:integrase